MSAVSTMPDAVSRLNVALDGRYGIERCRPLARGVGTAASILLVCLTAPATASAQIWNSQEGRYSSPM